MVQRLPVMKVTGRTSLMIREPKTLLMEAKPLVPMDWMAALMMAALMMALMMALVHIPTQ